MKKHTMITKTIQIAVLTIGLLTSYGLFSADESTIVNGELVKSNLIETVEVNETIAEQFIITSVENGILRGELLDGKGEGIYYELNDKELEKYPAFYKVEVNDLIMIEWTKDNYDNGQWTDIVKASYNKQGNKES